MSDQESGLVQYLLGEAPAAEQEAIHRRVLTEEGFDQELMATADDLIHAYLAGSLSADERARFETHFLSMPRHRERLAFVRHLLGAVNEVAAEEARAASPRGDAWRRWGAVAAVLVALAAVILVLAWRPTDGRPRDAMTSPEARPSAVASPGPGSSSPQPRAPRPMDVRVVRLPRELKAPVEVVLSPETRAVRVELPVAPGPPSFDAVVRTNEGARVWSAESLEPPLAGAPLAVTVPAEVFASDRYVLVVQAEPLRGSAAPRALEYTLRVRRER